MTIGEVAVGVVPDARDFWVRFRAQTSGQAEREGRRQGDEFRRGMQDTAGRSTVRLRADVDTTRARVELASLQQQGSQAGGGLLAALLPLAPALAPLGAAAGAVGSTLAATFASAGLAVLGFKAEITDGTRVGNQAAASIGAVKNALSGLEGTAAKAALPGLQASVLAITTQVPKLRQVVAGQAALAGDVVAHLTRGLVGGFENFGPVITLVSRDVDELAAHFEAWSTGPGGARFAQTLASDYAKVRPEIISIEHAVADLLAAGSSSGLGIVSLIGDLSRAIDAFPRPVLTAIIDGFLAFKAVGLASGAVSGISAAFASVRSTAVSTSASIRLSSLQATEAREQEAAAAAIAAENESRSDLERAVEARTTALEIIHAREGVQVAYSAQAQALLASAEEEIAAYRLVAQEASAAATQQVAAATEASAAAETAGAAAGTASLSAVLGPIGLAVGGLLLLTTAFGSSGDAAQSAASQIDGYTRALVTSRGAIDASVRSTVAQTLAADGLGKVAAGAGVSQGDLVSAVITGGRALDAVADKYRAYGQSQHYASAATGILVLDLHNAHEAFVKGTQDAAAQAAGTDNVTAASRAAAEALHATVGAYAAATAAAEGSVEKTREQTVAFQLANDAASLLSNALKSLAGQNLGVAQAETAFQQSIHTTVRSLRENHDAILGNSDAALANQQALQGTVSAARQYADAVAHQTGSSKQAASAYRNSRDALLAQLQAQGRLTPALRRYIDTLFDVRGVSDYLRTHPTKLDVDTSGPRATIAGLRKEITNIRQGRVPGITVGTAAANRLLARLQAQIDALRGKTVTVTTDFVANRRSVYNSQVPQFSTGSSTYNSQVPSAAAIPAPPRARSDVSAVDVASLGVGGAIAQSKAATRAANAAAKAADSVQSAAAALRQVGDAAASSASALASAGKQFLAAGRAAGLSRSQMDGLRASVSQLTALGARRDAVDNRLGTAPTAPTAYERLATAQGNFNSARSSVRSAFTGSFDITRAGGNQYGEPVTFRAVKRELDKAVANAKRFTEVLRRLDREGLGSYLIQQLADAGPAALPQALALLQASPKQLRALSGEYRSLGKYGTTTGTQVANEMYGVGVKSAQGLVDGLLSQQRQLNGAIRQLADSMVATLRSELDMHSPSRRLFNEGALAFEGLALGVESKYQRIEQAAAGAGAKSIPGRNSLGSTNGVGGPAINELHLHYSHPDDYHRATATGMRAATAVLR